MGYEKGHVSWKRGIWKNAYVAGFFDGEGSLGITRTIAHGKYVGYHGVIQISQTNFEVLEFIKEEWGGTLDITKRKNEKSYWKKCWRLRMGGKKIYKFLKDILPYLIVKRPQAELYLKFQPFNRVGGLPDKPRYTQEEIKLRERIYHDMSALNHRGK